MSKIPSSGSTASSTTLGSLQGQSSPALSPKSSKFIIDENGRSSAENARQSAILLYQALAGNSSAGSKNDLPEMGGSDVNVSGSQEKTNSSDDFHSKGEVFAEANEVVINLGMAGRRRPDDRDYQYYSYNSNEMEDDDRKQGNRQQYLKNINGKNCKINPLHGESGGDGADDESAKSSKTSKNSRNGPSPMPSSFTEIILQNKKKIGTLILSIATLWAYSQFRDYNHRKRRYFLRHGTYRGTYSYMNIGATLRYLMQFVSPLAVMKQLHFLTRNKLEDSVSLTAAASSAASLSSQPWSVAKSTPLSHLLAMAKAGNVSKVMLRGSVVSYLHSMKSVSPQSQRWSQTTLPSKNSSILNELMSTLIQSGCDDITTLPESLWKRFINGPAVMVLPFAYLAALYWMMRRLQKEQLGDGNDDDSFTIKTTTHNTTFDDVAGIDSSLQELTEVVNYIRQPAEFHSVGAHPPRGILLYGRSGTGKTLLARAIAGEAGRKLRGISGATVDSFAVCSGSDFVETYVGRGAARVRALFRGVRQDAWRNFERRQRQQALERARMQRVERRIKRYQSDICSDAAKKSTNGAVTRAMSDVGERVIEAFEGVKSLVNMSSDSFGVSFERDENQTPIAIIFIDEIDALAKRRDSGMGLPSSLGGGGCDEREQTLNALLTEMDGFSTGISTLPTTASSRMGPDSVIVIVIAATNRKDILDPAILRPGRFDRHVEVPLPDASGREAILRVHARRIRLDKYVNLREVAAGTDTDDASAPTENFSGADLKNVINEAALLAVRSGSSVVQQNHLLLAAQKVRRIVESNDSRYKMASTPRYFVS